MNLNALESFQFLRILRECLHGLDYNVHQSLEGRLTTQKQQSSRSRSRRSYPALNMDDDSIICCWIVICIISFATGFPSVYYGQKCKNAALRAQRKALCKNFSNDASALALQIFGWILSIPWLMALCYCVSKCCPGGVAVDVEV